MKVYLLYGPQGSGKSTQAKLLCEKLGLVFISTGQISRNLALTNPEIKKLIDSGNPTPHEIIDAELEKIFEANKNGNGFIFDGYPRYSAQIDTFLQFLIKHQWEVTKVIYFKLPEEVGVERIMQRAKTEGRKDDTPESIARRLELYHQQTQPIINYFRTLGKVVEIDGTGTVDQVQDLILQVLND